MFREYAELLSGVDETIEKRLVGTWKGLWRASAPSSSPIYTSPGVACARSVGVFLRMDQALAKQ